MKTKTNIITGIRLITGFLVAFGVLCASQGSVQAGASIPMTSGIKSQTYKVTWCSPHKSVFTAWMGQDCVVGKFTQVGSDGVIEYNGNSFPTGGVGAYTPTKSMETRTGNDKSTVTKLINLFNNFSGLKIKGEGTIEVESILVDYAGNIAKNTITYQIDKTAPDFFVDQSSGISVNSLYAYHDTAKESLTIPSPFTVKTFDSINTNSVGWGYSNRIKNPLTDYLETSGNKDHTRPILQTLYFRDTNSREGANTPFTINYTYNDAYNLAAAYVSDIKENAKISFVNPTDDSNKNLLPAAAAASKKLALDTGYLVANDVNTQKSYKIRLYDNTCGIGSTPGNCKLGNYAETAFYAVRDNTAPNMGGNGLELTEEKAIEKLLTFSDDVSVFDKSTTGYSPKTSGFSRFIGANTAATTKFTLIDMGISGNGMTSGIGCNTEPALCNAGVSVTNVKLQAETPANPSSYALFQKPIDRFKTDKSSSTFDIQNSDGHGVVGASLASNGTYRYYATKMETGTNAGICDLVGNCLTPNLKFRVTANELNKANSLIALDNSQTIMRANGSDFYSLKYELKDVYNNKVVGVSSVENLGNTIKKISSDIVFDNGLNVDQRKMPSTSSSYGTRATGTNMADNEKFDAGAMTNNAGIQIIEKASGNPDGKYDISITSTVPTKAAYPYLPKDSVFNVKTIHNQTSTCSTDSSMVLANNIGCFDNTFVGNVGSSLVTIKGQDAVHEMAASYETSVDAGYGTITSLGVQKKFADVDGVRKLNFEFATPAIYIIEGFKTLVTGPFVSHNKSLYSNDASIAPGVRVYEKFVSSDTDQDKLGFFNYRLRKGGATGSGMDINGGVVYGPLPGGVSANFFNVGSLTQANGLDVSSTVKAYEIQQSNPANKVITGWKKAYVSALSYSANGDTVIIPSRARSIYEKDKSPISDSREMSSRYFTDNYSLTESVSNTGSLTANEIAVTGLTNRYNSLTTDVSGKKANVNVGQELTRMGLVKTIKENVSTIGRGRKWCTGGTMTTLGSSAYSDCTFTKDGESITLIKGNLTIDCSDTEGGMGYCDASNVRRSIIVQDGSVFIKSNISTLDSSGNQTPGQLFIGVMTDGVLNSAPPIVTTGFDITTSKTYGWMFIDKRITNIDAFLFAQGAIVSTNINGNLLFTGEEGAGTSNGVFNQLHVMGSMLSLNTIGGSRKTTPECPYIISGSDCNSDKGQIFDLIYLRRFSLVAKSAWTGVVADDTKLVPYHPDGFNVAKESGGLSSGNTCSAGHNGRLRCIIDPDYRPYPMLIERDLRWNTSPSTFFRVR